MVFVVPGYQGQLALHFNLREAPCHSLTLSLPMPTGVRFGGQRWGRVGGGGWIKGYGRVGNPKPTQTKTSGYGVQMTPALGPCSAGRVAGFMMKDDRLRFERESGERRPKSREPGAKMCNLWRMAKKRRRFSKSRRHLSGVVTAACRTATWPFNSEPECLQI